MRLVTSALDHSGVCSVTSATVSQSPDVHWQNWAADRCIRAQQDPGLLHVSVTPGAACVDLLRSTAVVGSGRAGVLGAVKSTDHLADTGLG